MSDFLTTLVERSMRPLLAVRPRAPLPFEPSPDAPALAWDGLREETDLESRTAPPRSIPPFAASIPLGDVPPLAPSVRLRPDSEPIAPTPVTPFPVIGPARRTVAPVPPAEPVVASTPEEATPAPRPSTLPEPDPKSAGRLPGILSAPREVRGEVPSPKSLPASWETRPVDPSPKIRASSEDIEPKDRPPVPSRDVAERATEHRPEPASASAEALMDRLQRWLRATLPPPPLGVEAEQDDSPPPSGPAVGPKVRPDVPRQTPVMGTPRIPPLAPPGVPALPLGIRPFLPPTPKADAREIPPPAPVVEVTIGRIEVRAEVSPPKAARRAAAPPVMTLDDYLRRREGVPHE